MNELQKVLKTVKTKNSNEPEFIQAVEEVFGSLESIEYTVIVELPSE